MRVEEANKITPGLYEITWKDTAGGGKSKAAVGLTANGDRWLAPTNWITVITDTARAYRAWIAVKSVRRLKNG